MEGQTFIIPEGFELKQTGDNQFTIVPKQISETPPTCQKPFYAETVDVDTRAPGDIEEIRRQQSQNVANRYENSFFKPRDVRDDYDFDDEEIIRGKSRDDLFEEKYGINSYNTLQSLYRKGNIKQLNRHEMELLRFCHGIDVKKFIKEEFERNPIELGRDENGNIYVKNPHKPVDMSDDREI